MRAGRLRHRVTVQRVVLTPDGGGGHTESWKDKSTFWASISPTTGRENYESMQLQDEITHSIRFRLPRDIRPRDRIKFGDRVFNIKYVLDFDERRHEAQALAEEGVPL